MANSMKSTRAGISEALIGIFDYLERQLECQEIFYERERMIKDEHWLFKLLTRNQGIQYVRVVQTKPEGGRFIKRRYYFDTFLVKRNIPGTNYKVWMVYVLPLQR